MAAELIVDFPLKRKHDVVRFAETSELYTVDRHEDKHELWYSKTEYKSMKRDIKRDVLLARASASDLACEQESGFWIGISHLLTPACALGVQACRRRCVRAVLAEQARQDFSRSESLMCDDIALASLAATRKAELSARMLGRLHQDCISQVHLL